MEQLNGRVAVVTCGGSPLASPLARALASAGASVAIVGDARDAEAVVADIEAGGRAALPVATNHEDRESVMAAFERVNASLGPVDVLVHAEVPAPALEPRAFVDLDEQRWDRIWERGFMTTLCCCQAAFTSMRGRGGRIVLVTPTLALSGAASYAAYAALAEAQRALAKSGARQWGHDGITVNCLSPAAEMLTDDAASSDALTLAAPALSRTSLEADIGPVLVFLAGESSRFLTGATLCVDGGVWMAP